MSGIWCKQSVSAAATAAPGHGHRHTNLPPGPGRPATAPSIVTEVIR
ncbi:hypothetical protein J2S43_001699 [Catenuloplanes nepalensis]|uniref:Uncharacterized protein n=1 Tax=Catenuloplanes nepalensis TaxID=587533 RepID=A0ABT9MP54_9ACTN|nr:hypothetical protein [Catenuloplanes nepalensis]MDP9793187.1 hypothetical protein [Catenuloplanes nepalensis]